MSGLGDVDQNALLLISLLICLSQGAPIYSPQRISFSAGNVGCFEEDGSAREKTAIMSDSSLYGGRAASTAPQNFAKNSSLQPFTLQEPLPCFGGLFQVSHVYCTSLSLSTAVAPGKQPLWVYHVTTDAQSIVQASCASAGANGRVASIDAEPLGRPPCPVPSAGTAKGAPSACAANACCPVQAVAAASNLGGVSYFS